MSRFRLIEVRKRRGLTQTELANKCGLKPSAISHFETGTRTPCLRNFKLLCWGLNCSADYLLGLKNKEG